MVSSFYRQQGQAIYCFYKTIVSREFREKIHFLESLRGDHSLLTGCKVYSLIFNVKQIFSNKYFQIKEDQVLNFTSELSRDS